MFQSWPTQETIQQEIQSSIWKWTILIVHEWIFYENKKWSHIIYLLFSLTSRYKYATWPNKFQTNSFDY